MKQDFTDSLIVLLNLSNPYTIIPCLLFTPHTGVNSLIIFIITSLYLFYRFKLNIRIPHDFLFLLFLIIFVFNMCIGIVQGTFAIGFISIFLCNVAFYFLLYNIHNEIKKGNHTGYSVRYISKGYATICYYQLGIVALMFTLTVILHLFNPLVNNISFKYDIFISNASREHSGVTYYFPYNICLFAVEPLTRMPFFQEYGMITGVFHEPHTMTYFVIPFVFLSFFYLKKRAVSWCIVALSILYVLVASSTTNFLCYVLTGVCALCLRYRKVTVFIVPIVIVGVLYFMTMENPIVDLIRFKFSSGSAEYSQSTLTYAFDPKTIFGSNFLDLSYLELSMSEQDVGLVIFILNIVFIIALGYRTICLCISKRILYRCVGLFSLYFILHSSKLALRTYSLELLMFVIFLVTICYNSLQRNKSCDLLEC